MGGANNVQFYKAIQGHHKSTKEKISITAITLISQEKHEDSMQDPLLICLIMPNKTLPNKTVIYIIKLLINHNILGGTQPVTPPYFQYV